MSERPHDCDEVRSDGQQWRRSAFCTGGQCVEWVESSEVCLLRDSKMTTPNQPTIAMRHTTWESLKTHLLDPDRPAVIRIESLLVTTRIDRWVNVVDIKTGVGLSFNPGEIRDFVQSLAGNRYVTVP